jgi:hypothetical protein
VSGPWIGWSLGAILQTDAFSWTAVYGRVPRDNAVRRDAFSDVAMGSDKGTCAYFNAGEYGGHCRDRAELPQRHAHLDFAGGVGIVGQDHVWEYPDEVLDNRMLPDVDVAVKTNVVADFAVSLNVA